WPRPAAGRRGWIGMVLDALRLTALGVVLQVGYRTLLSALGRPLPDGTDTTQWLVGTVVPFVVVFVVPTLLGDGASWGQRTVWLAPRWSGRRGTVGRRVARAASGGALWGALGVLAGVPAAGGAVAVASDVAAPLEALVSEATMGAEPRPLDPWSSSGMNLR